MVAVFKSIQTALQTYRDETQRDEAYRDEQVLELGKPSNIRSNTQSNIQSNVQIVSSNSAAKQGSGSLSNFSLARTCVE